MATSSWQQTDSDNSTMRIHVSTPEGAGPFPALAVIQHQGGVEEFIQGMTAQLAQDGYLAAAPDLYHRDGP
ncbi:MAG: dienelactone hydrolase family protein, partial [Methylocella sp.]